MMLKKSHRTETRPSGVTTSQTDAVAIAPTVSSI